MARVSSGKVCLTRSEALKPLFSAGVTVLPGAGPAAASKPAAKPLRLASAPLPPERIAASQSARDNGSVPEPASAPNITALITVPAALACACMSNRIARFASARAALSTTSLSNRRSPRAELRDLRRIDLDVIGGGAGALGHAGNRGALHRIVARGRGCDDPVCEHPATFAAERGDQD